MKKNDFEYNYIAPTSEERKEIESIRNTYAKRSASNEKLDQLRRLDFKVRNTPIILALVLGVVGILTFGVGLTMMLEWNMLVWGIVVSIVGLIPVAFAYPTYLKSNKVLRDKYSQQIIKLSDELLNEEKAND